MKRVRTALLAIVFAALPLGGAAALEAPESIRPAWGIVMESLLDPSLASKVSSPSINFNFGASVAMPFSPDSRFSFEPSADLYYYDAELWTSGQAVPTAQEESSAYVLGLLLDAPLVYSLPMGAKFTLEFGVGLCLDLRVALSNDPAKAADAPLMNHYFWDMGRFVTPSTLLRAEYKLTERVEFGLAGRLSWPIYNLWTGEGFGFFDRGMYLIDLSLRYRLRTAH